MDRILGAIANLAFHPTPTLAAITFRFLIIELPHDWAGRHFHPRMFDCSI